MFNRPTRLQRSLRCCTGGYAPRDWRLRGIVARLVASQGFRFRPSPPPRGADAPWLTKASPVRPLPVQSAGKEACRCATARHITPSRCTPTRASWQEKVDQHPREETTALMVWPPSLRSHVIVLMMVTSPRSSNHGAWLPLPNPFTGFLYPSVPGMFVRGRRGGVVFTRAGGLKESQVSVPWHPPDLQMVPALAGSTFHVSGTLFCRP